MPDQNIRFPETMWTRIKNAAEQKTTAVNQFFLYYYNPVKRFLRRLGVPENDVEDVTQIVFMKIFEGNLLKIADEQKGRFRSFILAVSKNILANWRRKEGAIKRGGGNRILLFSELSKDEETDISQFITSKETDAEFDTLWTEHIVQKAMDRLHLECKEKNLPYFEALDDYLNDRNSTYESIAAKMEVNDGQVRNYISRGRKKLAGFIRDEIAAYCSSPEEFEQELKYLSQFLVTKH